jgi:hypothetical protein
MRPQGKQPPILLIDADDDPSGPEMDHLEATLAREAWPHAMVAREGGHALPDWDVEMALTFFDRTRTGSLPLSPPLSARPRRLHPPPDADAEAPAEPAPPASASASAPASASASAPPSSPDPTSPDPDPAPSE